MPIGRARVAEIVGRRHEPTTQDECKQRVMNPSMEHGGKAARIKYGSPMLQRQGQLVNDHGRLRIR